MSSRYDVNNLKFPMYSGWVSIKEGVLTYTRYWMVLCNGKLLRYKDWRQNFMELDNIIHVRRDYLTVTELRNRWIKVGDFSFQAENNEERSQWIQSLRNVLDISSDVKYSIEQCKNLILRWKDVIQRDVGRKYKREILYRLLGILTISKDATTHRTELESLSFHLKKMGYASLLCELYTQVLEEANVETVTDEMLKEPGNSDNVSDSQMLIYLLRRLIWRFAYANKLFALEVTRTEYIKQITKDAHSLLGTANENWADGSYLLFSTLNCLQQFAKTPCKRDVFYKTGTFDFLIELRGKEISNKVKMSSLLTLSHVVKENDLHVLEVDEGFMKYFMDICTKSVENNDHFANICNRTPHLTEVREIFDSLCKLCRLEHNRNIVLQKNIAIHLKNVTKGEDKVEIVLALRLIEMISKSPGGRTLFQEEKDTFTIRRVMELQNSDDEEISPLAKKVYDILKKRESKYVRELGAESRLLYLNAINQGSVHDRSIKVFIVGHASAGKTTLLKRLMADNIVGIESTEGIDIYAQKFVVDLRDGTWNIKIFDEHHDAPGSKMATAIQKWEAEFDLQKAEMSKKDQENKNEELKTVNDKESSSNQRSEEKEHFSEDESTERGNVGCATESVLYQKEAKGPDKTNVGVVDSKADEIFEIESMLDLPEDFAFVTVYDFAGDEIYYATHHAYLSPHAVYVIVLDMSESNADLHSMKEKARFWFRSVLTYGTFKEGNGKLWCPPIIFVGTHKDRVLIDKSDETKTEFAKEQVNSITEIPVIEGMNTDFIIGTFFVDNTDANDSTFQLLKKAIVKGAVQQRYWNERVPIKWIACEREICLLRKKKGAMLSEQSLKDHLEQEGLIFHNEKEYFEMLRYLHHMGSIIHLQRRIERIYDNVLIHPHWLVNAFKHLIGYSHLDHPQNKSHKKLLSQLGMLKASYVNKQLEKMGGLSSDPSVIVAYMEELNLFARIKGEDAFLLPGLLQEQTLSVFLEQAFISKNMFKTSALCFVFGENFIADVLFDKVLAACVSKWEVLQINDRYLLARRKGVFKLEGQWNLILVGQNSALQLLLCKFTDDVHEMLYEIGSQVRLFIKKTLQFILDTSSQSNIHPQEFIQCQILQSKKNTWVRVSDLFKYKTMRCCEGEIDDHHFMTSEHLCQWYPLIPDFRQTTPDKAVFEDTFHTPPESPTVVKKFDLCSDTKFGQHKFKKIFDATYTSDQVRSIVSTLNSIGQIVCPNFMGTCFRVGSIYIMTSFHLVKDIMQNRSQDSYELNPANLQTNVYILFQQQHEQCKLNLKPVLPFYDEELDVAVLALDLEASPCVVFPPPLNLSFSPPVYGQTFTLCGFGHPSHNMQALEFNVMTLGNENERVVHAKRWVEQNTQVISNILAFAEKHNYSFRDIEQSYYPVDMNQHVAIDCFMEKGASGAPGVYFPADKLNPEVSFMVSGGLPIFYFDLNEYHKTMVPTEVRMEYGVTMAAIRQRILDYSCMGRNDLSGLCNDIFCPV